MREIPVGLDGGELGVVVVESAVLGSLQLLGNRASKKQSIDAVRNGVVLVLIKGKENKSVLHKVRVVEQRLKE